VKFYDDLRVAKRADGRWVLLDPITYYGVPGIGNITVPEGFDTDFASVPRLPFMFMLLGDRADYAAVLHDYIYRNAQYSRDIADAAFRWVAEQEGMGWLARWAMWSGLRIGGYWSYDQRHPENKGD
jgi:hypothetical protein